MMKPKAKIKRNERDKDVSGANVSLEAKDADSSNNSRHFGPIGPSTSQKCAPTSWFTSEIRSMMFGFGDCPKPSLESAKLVEKVVHQQMISLLSQASDLAESRGTKLVGIEDFLFILRKDKVKLARLIRYVSLRDLKAAVEPEDDLSAVAQSDSKAIVVKYKRRKLCKDFLASIDQTGEFAALFDEELFDDVRYERDKRADLCTRFMNDQQYFKFAEARQISFAQKNRGYSKLREWLLQNENEFGSDVLKLDSYAMEVLSYLAFETVAQIVDLALLVKHDSQRSSLDPIGQSIGPGTVNADFPCVQAPLPQTSTVLDPSALPQPSSPNAKSKSRKFKKLMEASNYSGTDAGALSTGNGIQPAHIREAIRRFYHPLTPFSAFKITISLPLSKTCKSQRVKPITVMSNHRLPFSVCVFLLSVSLAVVLHVALATTSQTVPTSTTEPPKFPKYPSGCEGEFQHRCLCGVHAYGGKDRTVTNCTNTGFTEAESLVVLKEISPDTEVLIFTGNTLPTLPANVFGTENTYEHLKVVDLSNNGINTIQGQAFHRIPFVEKLILNDNKISLDGKHPRLFANVVQLKELHARRAFDKDLVMFSLPMIFDSGLKNLAVLDLSQNGIGPGINKERLCAFPHLKTVNLSGNALMHLVWNTSCLPKLLKLDLSHNGIGYLEDDTMAEMDTVPGLTVNLEGNPFQCDCNMVAFYKWLHETDVLVAHKEGFVCSDGFPSNNTKATVLSLSEENLQCQETISYVAPHFGFLHVVLLIVALVLALIIVAFAIYNRKGIVKAARVTFSPVTRRMQYSAIKKDTETREVEL